jgi:hypothetical protein
MADSSSILTADFGSVYTRATLIEAVDGIYQMVARAEVRSTGGFPAGDVGLGLRQAIGQIERVTGRKLLDSAGSIITPEDMDRAGVDYFLATASGGRSLRAVLVGLMPNVSLESARHAIEGSYVEVVDTISLIDERTEEQKLNAFIAKDPDIVFITGGTDGGAVEPLAGVMSVVKLAVASMPEGNRPTVIYAGNERAADVVKLAFAQYTDVLIADNVRPDLNAEDLRDAQYRIGQAFDEYKEAQGSGFPAVSKMSTIGLLPTAQSYRTVTRFMGVADEDIDSLIVVDVGSSSGVLTTYAEFEADDTKSTISTDIGLGLAAPAMLNKLDIDRVRRWIPFGIARADLENYVLNKAMRPSGIPLSYNDLYIEHALLRAGIEFMLEGQRPRWIQNMPKVDRIIAAGSPLSGTGNPALTAMLLLDAFKPSGAVELYSDPNGLIAAMGAVAYVVPEAVVQLLHGSNLDRLGTAFVLNGKPRYGDTVGKYRIDYGDGEVEEGEVKGGGIYVLNLPVGRQARVTVRMNRLGRGNVSIGGRQSVRRRVDGGLAGVIIDARGRPLPLATSLNDRARYIPVWYEFVTGVEYPTLEDDTLVPATEREPIVDLDFIATGTGELDAPAPRRRGGLFGRRKQSTKATPTDEASLDDMLGDDFDADVLDMTEEDDLDDLRL